MSHQCSCPHCIATLKIRPEWAGRTATCTVCKGRFTIAARIVASNAGTESERLSSGGAAAKADPLGSVSRPSAPVATSEQQRADSPADIAGEDSPALEGNWGHCTAVVPIEARRPRPIWQWAAVSAAAVGLLAAAAWLVISFAGSDPQVSKKSDPPESSGQRAANGREKSLNASQATRGEEDASPATPPIANEVNPSPSAIANEVDPSPSASASEINRSPVERVPAENDDQREDHGDRPSQPPIALVAGRPIPGRYLVLDRVRIRGGGMRMEIEEQQMARLSPEPPEIDPAAKRGTATTAGFSIGSRRGQVEYEVRPLQGAELKLEAVLTEQPFVGVTVQAYLWTDQPYEILDSAGKVVFRSGGARD